MKLSRYKWVNTFPNRLVVLEVHVDTSIFALKTNLASSKTEVDKLVIDKLAPAPVDLKKLSDVVKNDVFKKLFMINWLQK